jgi:hypothetical protein
VAYEWRVFLPKSAGPRRVNSNIVENTYLLIYDPFIPVASEDGEILVTSWTKTDEGMATSIKIGTTKSEIVITKITVNQIS